MTWTIYATIRDPLRTDNTERTIGPYATQDLARWWAVAFAQRGSISCHMGQPDEECIPIQSVVKMDIREDEEQS